jgi:hypothetical protein
MLVQGMFHLLPGIKKETFTHGSLTKHVELLADPLRETLLRQGG